MENRPVAKNEISFTTSSGDDVKLSPAIVRNYLVNGNAHVTDQEVFMFMQLCRFQGLNPFLREAYLIKYSSKDPASMVIGFEAFKKRASEQPEYEGHLSGVIVLDNKDEVVYRKGAFTLPTDKLVGAWCNVFIANRHPFEHEISLGEYAQGSPIWSRKPATMIRKVVTAQALRECFPARLSGLYAAEEMGRAEDKLPKDKVLVGDVCEEPELTPPAEHITKDMIYALEAVACGDKQLMHDVAARFGYDSVSVIKIEDVNAVQSEMRKEWEYRQAISELSNEDDTE